MLPDNDTIFKFECNYKSINDFKCSLSRSDNFFIFSQNIRSFNKNYDDLAVFLNTLNIDIDVIVLSETWFSPTHTSDIDGYTGHHIYRDDRVGGGVSIFIRDTLRAVYISEMSFISDHLECCTVQIRHSTSDRSNLTVVALYRPPNTSVADFTSCLEDVFLECSQNRRM